MPLIRRPSGDVPQINFSTRHARNVPDPIASAIESFASQCALTTAGRLGRRPSKTARNAGTVCQHHLPFSPLYPLSTSSNLARLYSKCKLESDFLAQKSKFFRTCSHRFLLIDHCKTHHRRFSQPIFAFGRIFRRGDRIVRPWAAKAKRLKVPGSGTAEPITAGSTPMLDAKFATVS